MGYSFKFLFGLTLLLIIAILILTSKTNKTQSKLIVENKTTIAITLANTEEKKIQGYSQHLPISYQEGMLFVYDQPNFYSFWMKDMLFDLDFIFIKDQRIVDLVEDVKAPPNNHGQIEYINSKKIFNKVLEVRSGFIKKYKTEINNRIQIYK